MADSPKAKKILVCDDDETFSDLLELLLVKEGFEVVTTNNGLDCLDRLVADKPDMLVIDLNMPKPDGFQILEALDKDNFTKSLPVVVISGDERKEDMELVNRLGAKLFLVKPINCDNLVTQIKKMLAEGGQKNGAAD